VIKSFGRLALAILPLIVSLAAWGAVNAKVDKLFDSPSRPTVSDLMEAFDGQLPAKNPFSFNPSLTWSNAGRVFRPTEQEFKNLVLNEAPRTIARMEKAFPGAVWISIGRDAATFGDLLDAFYRSMGRNDAVRRLEVSTGSFAMNDVFLDYLKQLGVPLDPKTIETATPVIFFDRTTFGTWRVSQSQQVLQAGYDAYRKAGGNTDDLIRKFNFMTTEPISIGNSLGKSRGINGDLVDAVDVDQFLANQAKQVKSSGSYPNRILALGSNLSDLAEWHAGFGQITRDGTGKIVAAPGALTAREHRERVLWEIYEVIAITSSQQFRDRISQEAANLKYEFQFKNNNAEAVREKISAIEAQLKEKRREVLESILDLPKHPFSTEFIIEHFNELLSFDLNLSDVQKLASRLESRSDLKDKVVHSALQHQIRNYAEFRQLLPTKTDHAHYVEELIKLPLDYQEIVSLMAEFSDLPEVYERIFEYAHNAGYPLDAASFMLLRSASSKEKFLPYFFKTRPTIEQFKGYIGSTAMVSDGIMEKLIHSKIISSASELLSMNPNVDFVISKTDMFFANPNPTDFSGLISRLAGRREQIQAINRLIKQLNPNGGEFPIRSWCQPTLPVSENPVKTMSEWMDWLVGTETVGAPTVQALLTLFKSKHGLPVRILKFTAEERGANGPATVSEVIALKALEHKLVTVDQLKNGLLDPWYARSQFFKKQLKQCSVMIETL